MSGLNTSILLIFGIGVFGGTLGAWLFQRVRVPQVVGYIAIGVLLGGSGLNLIRPEAVTHLNTFNLFALGVIGFLVGGELQLDSFREYGRQYMAILLGEGLASFALVGVSTGLVAWYVLRDPAIALATGVILGAIASATDPASTISVLWEYRARGALTTALVAIVALDDALAMTLYGAGTSVAQTIAGRGANLARQAWMLTVELGGAVAVGAAGGLLLTGLLRLPHHQDRALTMALGTILLIIGACGVYGMDIIVAGMTLGFVLINAAPHRTRDLFALMRSFSAPIYVMFFVLVGARLTPAAMPGWLWALVALYVAGRSAGKYVGAYWGARASGAEQVVASNAGLGLFAQGGVAVGLSIMAGQHLSNIDLGGGLSVGDMIIAVVTATTLVVQIVGPPMVKVAIRRAREFGCNVTEADVIAELAVADVMQRTVSPVPEHEPVRSLIKRFSSSDHLVYPVVGPDDRLVGIIKLETLKNVLPNHDTWEWLVAGDVAEPSRDKALAGDPLKKALDLMQSIGIEELPVVAAADDDRPVGMLVQRHVRRRITEELIQRRRQAPQPASPAVTAH